MQDVFNQMADIVRPPSKEVMNTIYIEGLLSDIKGKKDNSGKVNCPRCEGKIKYNRVSAFSPVFLECSTKGCLKHTPHNR